MGYSFIPKSCEDIQANKELSLVDRKKLCQVFQAFKAMTMKDGKPEMEDPFAINIATPLNIKIHRSFYGEIDAKELGKSLGVTFTWGNGTRSKLAGGAPNRGSLFERRLTADFEIYKETRNPEKDNYFYKDFIRFFHENYGDNVKDIVVLPEGALNKKRPLVFSGSTVYIGQPYNQANIGKVISDITVKMDARPIYLSLKLGSTVTFFNIGITKYIKAAEIDAGEITDPQGRILLSIFGINPVFFASVFRAALNPKIAASLQKPKQPTVDVTSKIDKEKAMQFLMSGIGYGYHLVHAKNETSPVLEHMVMTKDNAPKYLKIERMVVRYPFGNAKRIDVNVDTPKFIFKLNFRNKGGGIYPKQLLCDYKVVHK